jgi:hypothetical protein
MENKSTYHCLDGRTYNLTMTWNENFKDAEKIFKSTFKAVDIKTKKELTLPREIATYAIGDMEETLGERVKHYYAGNREDMMAEMLTSASRRVCDWIERGK